MEKKGWDKYKKCIMKLSEQTLEYFKEYQVGLTVIIILAD